METSGEANMATLALEAIRPRWRAAVARPGVKYLMYVSTGYMKPAPIKSCFVSRDCGPDINEKRQEPKGKYGTPALFRECRSNR